MDGNATNGNTKLSFVVAAVSIGVAAVSIGALTGYLTSATSLDPDVVAAVVAALLAGLVGWIAWAVGLGRPLVPCLFAVIFSVSSWASNSYGVEQGFKNANERLEARLQIELVILRERLVHCSEVEFRTNQEREGAGLDPLPAGIVCGALLGVEFDPRVDGTGMGG